MNVVIFSDKFDIVAIKKVLTMDNYKLWTVLHLFFANDTNFLEKVFNSKIV